MKRLVQYFVRGLLITTPVALTLWICWWAVTALDHLVPLGFPGAGILLTVTLITVIGALAGTLVTKGVLAELERLLEGLPFVRIVYTSIKDLLNAFVGERRRFNRPVRIKLDEKADIWYLGFVTADALGHLGMPGHVAVYLPWSYSFAGRVILVPAEQVHPISGDSTDMLAFIISGGVARSSDATARK